MANIKKNFVYQTLYQLLATALPLITSPYISRVIGAEGLGVYSYTLSIANYFMLTAMLGVNHYGSKSIAVVKDDKDKLSKVFCEIYSLQIILSVVSLTVYLCLLAFLDMENIFIALIQAIVIINCLFDINWLYFGLEHIKITVTRNIVVKILTLLCIFAFVHSADDLWIYTLIMAGGTLISEIVLFWNLKKYIRVTRVSVKSIFLHLKPNFVLFIPIIALSVFHFMDKTMLGALSDYNQTGYYYNVDKIINIPLGIITGLGTVLLPRSSILINKNDREGAIKLFNKSFELVFFLSSIIVFGIASISKTFIPWFFGNEYVACTGLLNILVFVVYFKAISQTIRTQYLIPANKNLQYIRALGVGAVCNFILNFVLISKIGALGAVLGTLISEAFVCIWHIKDANMEYPIVSMIKKNWFYPLAGVIMFGSVRCINLFVKLSNTTFILLLSVVVGSFVYLSLCLVYWVKRKNGIFYDLLKKRLNPKR